MSDAAETPTPRERPGPARSLTREQVVATALEVLASEGLSGVSFRRIAVRLGVDAKALYTYVADKNDLMVGMYDATLAALDVPQEDDARAPVDVLVDMYVSMRRLLSSNADLIHVAPSRQLQGSDLDLLERVWRTLTAVVPDPGRAVTLHNALNDLTIGSALRAARQQGAVDLRGALAEFEPGEHPQSYAFAEAAVHLDEDAAFEATLRALIDQAAGEPA